MEVKSVKYSMLVDVSDVKDESFGNGFGSFDVNDSFLYQNDAEVVGGAGGRGRDCFRVTVKRRLCIGRCNFLG